MISAKKRMERLQMALEVLNRPKKDLPVTRFDMETYGLIITNSKFVDGEWEEVKCGTAACLAGTLACDPWFTRRGLKNDIINGRHWSNAAIYKGEETNWDEAIENFFGITYGEADALVSAGPSALDSQKIQESRGYIGIVQARGRVRRLIERYSADQSEAA